MTQSSPDIAEPVAYQFRQRSGIGKGPQSQAPWCDWCGIEREDYERYLREPSPLIQVRPLYASPQPARSSAGIASAWLEGKHGGTYRRLTAIRDGAQLEMPTARAIADALDSLLYSPTDVAQQPSKDAQINRLRYAILGYFEVFDRCGGSESVSPEAFAAARQGLREALAISSTDREPPDYGYCLCGRHRDDQCDYCVSLSSPQSEPQPHGCKRAGGFVDTSCNAMCDCHVTLSRP